MSSDAVVLLLSSSGSFLTGFDFVVAVFFTDGVLLLLLDVDANELKYAMSGSFDSVLVSCSIGVVVIVFALTGLGLGFVFFGGGADFIAFFSFSFGGLSVELVFVSVVLSFFGDDGDSLSFFKGGCGGGGGGSDAGGDGGVAGLDFITDDESSSRLRFFFESLTVVGFFVFVFRFVALYANSSNACTLTIMFSRIVLRFSARKLGAASNIHVYVTTVQNIKSPFAAFL